MSNPIKLKTPGFTPANSNYTDIYTAFDGTSLGSRVVVPLTGENETTGAQYPDNSGQTAYLYDGKIRPIVMYNHVLLQQRHILFMRLLDDAFTPHLYIVLDDAYGDLKFSNTPGYDNQITIVMLPWSDSKYKGVKLDFYIENIIHEGTNICCRCELKYMPLERRLTKQVKFRWPSPGCPSHHNDYFCNGLAPNDHPTTFELLHQLAEESGLGFAATDMCKGIKDDKHRLMNGQTIKEYIPQQVKFGGLDENSVFDTWIDLYGHICLINLSWVLSQNIDYSHLATFPESGGRSSTVRLPKPKTTDMTYRVITNHMSMRNTSLHASMYVPLVNNDTIFEEGSCNTYHMLKPLGAGDGANNMQTHDIRNVENSIDGKKFKDEYAFERKTFIGVEMGSSSDNNTPILQQSTVVDRFLKEKRAKRIIVKMTYPNFGLTRGMLVGLSWFEYAKDLKQQIILNQLNIQKENKQTVKKLSKDDIAKINDENVGLPNESLNGIYYIDAVKFEYTAGDVLTQYLYLFKKDAINNYASHASPPKMNHT